MHSLGSPVVEHAASEHGVPGSTPTMGHIFLIFLVELRCRKMIAYTLKWKYDKLVSWPNSSQC